MNNQALNSSSLIDPVNHIRSNASLPQVQNITAGFRYSWTKEVASSWTFRKNELIRDRGLKCCGNLGIIKTRFTFIISLTSGYVTITGLRFLSQIDEAREEILEILQLAGQSASPCTIHNICASGRFNDPIPLSGLRPILKKEDNCRVVSNRQYFPGLFVKVAPSLGTIILFQSGSYTIVGAKCLESIWRIHDLISAIIHRLS